jgi:uncharacterized spore protein YtfJ
VSETREADLDQSATRSGDRVAAVMEKLISAADVSRVYGEPIRHGETLLLPAAEILAIAGFGMGSGSGTSDAASPHPRRRGAGGGGGGGGRTLARTVAVIAGFVWAHWKAASKGKRFRL